MSLIESITSDIQKLNSKIEQEKKTALKSRKKLETTGFDIVTQPQDNLKSVNKKTEIMGRANL